MLEELLQLLSCHELSAEELADAAAFVRQAPEDPELEWLDDIDSKMTFAIFDKLSEFIAVSDKIDELHEQLIEMFADPLPQFPHEHPKICKNTDAYFQWLDTLLANRAPAEGGYELVSINTGIDDNLSVLVVYRRDTQRILDIAQSLSVRISRMNGTEY